MRDRAAWVVMTVLAVVLASGSASADPGRATGEAPATPRAGRRAARAPAARTPAGATPRAARPASSAREASGPARAPRSRRPRPPCLAPAVEMIRHMGGQFERSRIVLTFCDGRPHVASLDALSVLARPSGTDRPTAAEIRAWAAPPPRRRRRRGPPPPPPHDRRYVVRDVLRLDPGLLSRVQRLATRWPGRSIEILSGYRPHARDTSRHHVGRALDLRVRGVSRETLRDFARAFEATGVGYYPNSVFVHVDVRDERAYWVDRSGPGESADYGRWPPTQRESTAARHDALALAERALERLTVPTLTAEPSAPAELVAAEGSSTN